MNRIGRSIIPFVFTTDTRIECTINANAFTCTNSRIIPNVEIENAIEFDESNIIESARGFGLITTNIGGCDTT